MQCGHLYAHHSSVYCLILIPLDQTILNNQILNMKQKKEISELTDIKNLVDAFYAKVRADTLLGPIFNTRIKDHWDGHLATMYRFWQTVLLGEHTYFGSPFPPHTSLGLQSRHFERWKQLFNGTVDERFVGKKAEEAKSRAEKMAVIFQYKILDISQRTKS